MASNRLKAMGRRDGGAFAPLPVVILRSDNFKSLSPNAKNLFLCMLSQVNFGSGGPQNNGDQCAAFSIAKEWGIGSKTTLHKVIQELLERGWIEQTREVVFSTGERNKPNLYAITYWSIDDCGGKVKSTKTPSGKWKQWVKS